MNRRIRNFLVALMTAYVFVFGAADAFAANRMVLGNAALTPLSASAGTYTANTLAELRSKIAKDGRIRVIAGVRSAFAPEGEMDASSVLQQRKEIADMHAAVLKKIPSLKAKPEKVRTFSTIPFMALEIDAAELEALAGQTEITSIEEDRIVEPTLAESVPLIGGTAAWSSGYTGVGQTVAILDTGVDKTHSFLAGKVVAEACYSTNYASYNSTSICPGGVTQTTATGSAMPYAGTCPAGGCDHGTHVAGIAAGKGTSYSGIAKDASLIAIQIFSRFDNVSICGSTTPCALSYTSDQILGLQQVYALRNTYNIAAVNMSLGGGQYFDQSTCDSSNSSIKSAIDNLRSVKIATIVASGNNGYTNSMSAPGCISTAVSVGSTWDAAGWTNNCAGNNLGTSFVDQVACYSNSASFLNLLAPGSAITSSIPGGGYATWHGTSMATPHVAGSWALLKQQNTNLTVTDALNLLSSAGTAVTDPRNGITKSRTRIDAALNVALNVPPTLTYSSDAGYGTVGVNPPSGTSFNLFTYKVIYTDISNSAPTSIRVCIDSICNAMSKDSGAANTSLRDGSYTNGEQYIYSTTLAAGMHNYYFNASRGVATVSLPASGTLSGPTVSDLTISTSTLPNGDVGVAYNSTLTASGGILPYSWSASGLPPGLSINSTTGVISNAPTQAGIFGFTATVSDATSAAISKEFSIIIVDSVAPTIPSGLSASAVSAAQINLGWTASTDYVGVTGYKVYRNGVQAGTSSGTSYSDNGLTSTTTYSYTVSACDAANNCSAQSVAATATTLNNPPPTVPTGLAASAVSATQIDLTWTASTGSVGAITYKIYRNGAQIKTASATNYSNTGLTAATTYSYTVSACDDAQNCSAQSELVTATTLDNVAPTVPTGLAASTISTTQIDLSWTASTDNVGVTGYAIYRNGMQVGTTTGPSYSDTGLTAATTYSYTIAACDAAANCSAQSAAILASTVDNIAPTAPAGLTATAVSNSQINLTWTASNDSIGVVGYKIERCKGSNCTTFIQIGTSTTTSFNNTGLIAKTTYRYRIRAYDTSGNNSAYSSIVKATTLR